jgi:hypothetical protein
LKKLLLLLSLFVATPAYADEVITQQENITEPINSSMTKIEKKVRNAAVKVHSGRGHGSGSLVKYKGAHFIITAFHVIKAERVYFGKIYQVKGISQTKQASLVYFDPQYDIAVLYLEKTEHFHYNTPMKWKPLHGMPDIGTPITYSGHPSWHNLMTFRGRVAGYEMFPEIGPQVLLNVFGWFGSSGSVVYTAKGEIVGVLWAVDVEQNPAFQVNEDIVWVSPIMNLKMDTPLRKVCQHAIEKPKSCD